MLEEYYNQKVNVKRLITDTDESPVDIEQYQDYLLDIPCLIQPLSDSYGQDFSGIYGKDFLMFCGDYDIKEKDLIVDKIGNEYLVSGVKRYSFLNDTHLELIIKLLK